MNLEIRKAMVAYRERIGATMRDMAKFAECSEAIIYGVECLGWITHPNIASRIAHVYKLDVDGYNDLVHKDHYSDVPPERKEPPKATAWFRFTRDNEIPFAWMVET